MIWKKLLPMDDVVYRTTLSEHEIFSRLSSSVAPKPPSWSRSILEAPEAHYCGVSVR